MSVTDLLWGFVAGSGLATTAISFIAKAAFDKMTEGSRQMREQLEKAEKYAERQELRHEAIADDVQKLRKTLAEGDQRTAWKDVWAAYAETVSEAQKLMTAYRVEATHGTLRPTASPLLRFEDWSQRLIDLKTKLMWAGAYIGDHTFADDILGFLRESAKALLASAHALESQALDSTQPAVQVTSGASWYFDNVVPRVCGIHAFRFRVHLGFATKDEYDSVKAAGTEEIAELKRAVGYDVPNPEVG